MRRLPPLDWIRVFEVAARVESFVAAGEILSVSPGAVSRTIKELEGFLGIRLFRRMPRGVELTEKGRRYAEMVAPAIAQIAQASDEISRRRPASELRATVMPALGECWLVPRLGDFRSQYPDISIEVSADAEVIEFSESDFDLALRYCDGANGDHIGEKLFDDELFPVAAPSLLGGHEPEQIQDLFSFPALQDKSWSTDWDVWLAEAGCTRPGDWHTSTFTLYSMALSAALAGQGVMIGHRLLIQEQLDNGSLVELFDLRVKSNKGFYLIKNPNPANAPSVHAFSKWLHGICGKYRGDSMVGATA